MGVDKFKITESVQAIIAQRLVRRLCTSCRVKMDESQVDEKLKYLALNSNGNPVFYESKGCANCNYTGYKGRIGLYEILILDDTLRDKINASAPLQEIRELAKERGFRNLFEDAISLIAEGITDYKEILRTINIGEDDNWKSGPKGESKLSEETHKIMPDPVHLQTDIGKVRTLQDVEAEKSDQDENIQILVVEDYDISRKMICKMIKKNTSWQVEEAEDGIKALQKIVENKPNVVLLDIMMPRMDGYELLQHLRAVPETSSIPVIFLTGLKTQESEDKGFELGADDYLTKPIKPDVMIKRIKKVMANRKKKTAPFSKTKEVAAFQDFEADDEQETDSLRLI